MQMHLLSQPSPDSGAQGHAIRWIVAARAKGGAPPIPNSARAAAKAKSRNQSVAEVEASEGQ